CVCMAAPASCNVLRMYERPWAVASYAWRAVDTQCPPAHMDPGIRIFCNEPVLQYQAHSHHGLDATHFPSSRRLTRRDRSRSCDADHNRAVRRHTWLHASVVARRAGMGNEVPRTAKSGANASRHEAPDRISAPRWLAVRQE